MDSRFRGNDRLYDKETPGRTGRSARLHVRTRACDIRPPAAADGPFDRRGRAEAVKLPPGSRWKEQTSAGYTGRDFRLYRRPARGEERRCVSTDPERGRWPGRVADRPVPRPGLRG